jgi:hypothetical protein
MGTWIDAARNKILDLLEDLCEKHQNFKIYVAFGGYRDFGDEYYYIDFTDDHRKIHTTLMSIDAIGGDDIPEDVGGAYNWAASLNWKADVRAVFHIGDAPNHGELYHDTFIEDAFPEGHPLVNLREEVLKLAEKNVDLTVFRLNRTTDIMFGLMKKEYEKVNRDKFRIVNFMTSEEDARTSFYSQVSSQLSYSMSTHDPTN